MATLFKTVKKTGDGDYTDLVTAINDMLVSGLAATGYYDQYVLAVDSGVYSGYFSASVPYSGQFNIVGSGTWFIPLGQCTISGETSLGNVNVEISDLSILGDSVTSDVFNIYSGSALSLIDTELLQITKGITNSGALYLNNVSSHGIGPVSGSYFIRDYGTSVISNSRISSFTSGIYSKDLTLTDSTLIDNTVHLAGYDELVSISNSLIYGGSSGIVGSLSEVHINSSSIKTSYPIVGSGILLHIGDSILYGAGPCITGVSISGTIYDTCMYPSSGTFANLSQTNVQIKNPQFRDSSNGDFRLVFKQTTGSPCVEYKDQEVFPSSVELYTEQAQFNIKDKRGIPPVGNFSNFIYKQGNTLLLTDYQKEIRFANTVEGYSDLTYSVEMMANFSASGVSTIGSFNKIGSPFPFDWDYKTFNTTEITDRHRYLIPRTVVDITDTISGFVGSWLPRVNFNKIDKRHIYPYLYADYRGVAFDYDLSIPGQAIVWMIEGINQTLIQLNAYTGEHLADYPLFVPDLSGRVMVHPSGLIYVGVEKDQYKYILESDPTFEILADNPDGRLKWILTEMDTHKDARGVLAYKNNLYLTVTEYNPQSILDRSTIPIYSGAVGRLLRYDNNNTFEHFIANYTISDGPARFAMNSGNCYPTDLTVYEDGTFLVADWAERYKLFRYKLAYDYALVQSTYDSETRIILREYYDNVEL